MGGEIEEEEESEIVGGEVTDRKLEKVGGWVGGWVGMWVDGKVEEIEAVRISYCGFGVGGWVGGEMEEEEESLRSVRNSGWRGHR